MVEPEKTEFGSPKPKKAFASLVPHEAGSLDICGVVDFPMEVR